MIKYSIQITKMIKLETSEFDEKVTVNMARNRKEASIIPSPFNFGAVFSDNLVDSEFDVKSPNEISEELLTIVKSTDQNVAVAVLLSLFSRIQKQEDNDRKHKLLEILNNFLELIQNQQWFRIIVLKFFNKLTEFPEAIIHQLNTQASFVLVVHGASSKYCQECQNYIQNNIIPNISQINSDKISQNVLYELCDLHLPDFDPDVIFGQKEQPEFSPYLSISKLSSQQNNVEISIFDNIPIQSVLAESNATLISQKSRLIELFSFYPDFNEYHAASFIFCLVQPHYQYKEYLDNLEPDSRSRLLEMHREIFEEKKLSVQGIIDHFPSLDIPHLQVDSCPLLFTILTSLTRGQQINPISFTQQWKSPQLQQSVLQYITVNTVPILDFSKTPKQIDFEGFIQTGANFDNCCNCWKSLEFVQRATQLLSHDNQNLNKFFEPLIQKHPAVLIAIFSRADIEATDSIIEIATQALGQLVHANLSTVVNELFKNSPSFITLLLLNLYKSQPAVIDRIYNTFSDHVPKLLELSDVFFATDCAMIAAANKTIEIGKFIESYTKRNGQESLQKIIDFIVQKVKHVNSQQLLVITNLFAYLSEHFSEYTIHQQIFIENAAKSAAEVNPAIAIPSYDIKIPQKLLNETREQANNAMTKLMSGQISPHDFFVKLSRERFVNPLFFSEIVSHLLSVIENVDDLKPNAIRILGTATAQLVISGSLTRSKSEQILHMIKSALNNEEQTPAYTFGIHALELILPKIDNFPQFIFDVMRETRIRDLSPEIFAQVQSIGQKINEPLHSTLPKTINVHPLLMRFLNMRTQPPPSVARALLNLAQEPTSLHDILKKHYKLHDWIALSVVDTIQDKPALLPAFEPYFKENSDFTSIVFQAASARSLQHILAPEFGKYEGCLRRRRLYVLGNLIGRITLKECRPILSRFLDLKKLLLYGVSQGKLYGIVPFVVAILSNADDFFLPPNPYKSGLLYILAGIYAMDSIKVYIKQQILGLFTKNRITLGLFDKVPKYFPLTTDGNYDYLIVPYSLIHFLSAPDIERITTFDTNILNQFVQQNIIISDNAGVLIDLKERIKEALVNYFVNFLHSEGPSLAEKASNTTLELVRKDFKNAQAPEISLEPAHQMVHQLAASLTLFNALIKIPRIKKELENVVGDLDSDWIDEIAAKNYEWISQVLRDAVAIRSWNLVKNSLMAGIDDERQHKGRNFSTVQPGISANGCIQAQRVYSEYLDISFSQQSYPISKDFKVDLDKEIDAYLEKFKKIVPFDSNYTESQTDESAIEEFLEHCPNFVVQPITFEQFKSILKAIFKQVGFPKSPSRPFEMVVCQVIERLVTSVPPSILEQARPYIMSWVHNLLPPYIVCDLVRLKLINERDLDVEFTSLMNSEPFNTRIMLHVQQALFYGMVETSKLSAREMISSLTFVCTIPQSELDISKDPINSKDTIYTKYSQYAKSLTKVFETVFAPETGIPSDTKLSKLITYDNLEKKHPSAEKWRAAFLDRDIMDYTDETKEVLSNGVSAIASVLFSESTKAVQAFMDCTSKQPGASQYAVDIIEAAVANVKGVGNVMGLDTTKYYNAIRGALVLLSGSDKFETVASLLHTIRPTIAPSFGFGWVQLVSDKTLIAPLLNNQSSWTSFFVLLADFIGAVGNLSKRNVKNDNEAFDIMYRALLRLILILSHDYNEFMASAAPLLVQCVPLNFTQLRNILLSLDSRLNSNFTRAAQQFTSIPDKFKNALSTAFPQRSFDRPSAVTLVQMIIEKDAPISLTYAFVYSLLQSMSTLKQSDNTEESPAYLALSVLFEMADAKHTYEVICAILDNVRGDDRESQNPKRLLEALLRSTKMAIKQGLTASELTLRAIIERVSAASKPPLALQQFYKEVITKDQRTHFLSEMNYMQNNPEISAFIQKNLANIKK